MYANDVCQQQSSQFGLDAAIVTCRRLALPPKSFCQRFLVVSDHVLSIKVERYPAADRDCRHQLHIEHGTLIKRVDLPATGRVNVSQQFMAPVGGQLSFEYVARLQAGNDSRFGSSSLTAELIDLTAQARVSLINRSVTSSGGPGDSRVASLSRELLSIPIGAAGPYELRLATSVDPQCSGSSAHLLIDCVRVCDSSDTTVTQLASVSCVGCARRAASPG